MFHGCGYPGVTTPTPSRSSNPGLSCVTPSNHDDHNITNHVAKIHGTDKSLATARTYYNKAQNQFYSRYNPADWDRSNENKYSLSNTQRSGAERTRLNAWQTVKSEDLLGREKQADNTLRLAKRRDDIAFWKNELNLEMKRMDTEIENLKEQCQVLHQAYQETKGPLATAEECFNAREKRIGIDRVADRVESSLTKEIHVIRECQDKMRRLIEKAHVQLKLNQAARQSCDADSTDKHHAQNIDDLMHQLHTGSACLRYYPGVEYLDGTNSDPASWLRFTQENIARSQRERHASEQLRGHIDATLRACANNIQTANNHVNNALQARIAEVQNAKDKLQAHLQRVNTEMGEQRRSLDLLRRAIATHTRSLELATPRLQERRFRRNVELCHDQPMKGLIAEVENIKRCIKDLEDKVARGERTLAQLDATRRALEDDIRVKENSLQIDRQHVQGLRRTQATQPRIGPVFLMPYYGA